MNKILEKNRMDILDAVKAGDVEMVRLLLAENPNLVNVKNQKGHTILLHWAAKISNGKDIAELLLAYKADVNAIGGKAMIAPLHVAAACNNRVVAEVLLANKADVNAKSGADWTPLHTAVLNNSKDVVELLLANGADVNAKGDEGETPLHVAVVKNNEEMKYLLRQHGGVE